METNMNPEDERAALALLMRDMNREEMLDIIWNYEEQTFTFMLKPNISEDELAEYIETLYGEVDNAARALGIDDE